MLDSPSIKRVWKGVSPPEKNELLSANGVFECNFRGQISHCNAHASVVETFDSTLPGHTEYRGSKIKMSH